MLNVKSLKCIQLSFTCGFPSLALVPKILLTVLFSFSLFIHRNYVVLAQRVQNVSAFRSTIKEAFCNNAGQVLKDRNFERVSCLQ